MSIKVLEVTGLDYAVQEAIALSGNEGYVSDSYWTYIENPETLNRAKFEFFLGDKDKELMLSLPLINKNTILRFISIFYMTIDKHIAKTSYYALQGQTSKESLDIISQLPYKELILGVI